MKPEEKVAIEAGLPIRGEVRGVITLVQEDRFRLEDQDGRGYLLTLGWKAAVPVARLHQWSGQKAELIVEFEEGAPDLGAVAVQVREA